MASKRARNDDVRGLLQRCFDDADEYFGYARSALYTLNFENRIHIRVAVVLCTHIPGLLEALKAEHIQTSNALPIADTIHQAYVEVPNLQLSEDMLVFCLSRCVTNTTTISQNNFIRAVSRLFTKVRPAPYGALTRRLLDLADSTGTSAAAYVLLYMTADRPGVSHDAGLVQRVMYEPLNTVVALHNRDVHGLINRDLLNAFMLDTAVPYVSYVVTLMDRNGKSGEIPDYCIARLALPGAPVLRLVRIIVKQPDGLVKLLAFMRTRFDVFAPEDVRFELLRQTMTSAEGVLVQRVCARLEIANHIAPVPRDEFIAWGVDVALVASYYGERTARPSVLSRATRKPARGI